ncbi:hypothetical protein, conserved [Perkinsus marinus ATCC 50983]|uniref:KN17 SH3-like domain-containing protein n=1 Tax=Perkinsus marinus (strain ATCC 50983 / TXsc) TaxID=423536 RepID=C5L5D7_PERM5|nr:hypothetical protein, conserved [Perkinsus marinus ATCC 50983]EER08056.1 hypothetical protein, conserved [Perkinsus marinus ATCC 50983]|eukprot:XP_002776240.1 hypothetical protein, conserved [Perkinsus marinus ATCC 50983]
MTEVEATTVDRKDENDKIQLEVTNLINTKRSSGKMSSNITPKVNVLEEAAAVKAAKDEAELWMKMEDDDDNDMIMISDHDDDDAEKEKYSRTQPMVKRQRKIDSNTEIMKKEEDDIPSDAWLMKGLIVKVLNKDLCNGKYYKSKGEIRKVLSPYVCHVKILKSGDILELDQTDLQTVTPANGRTIQVVLGQYKYQFGVLKSVDPTTGSCTIILVGDKTDKEVILRPDDICKV